MNKFDAKYQQSADKMINALMTLLQKKDFAAITVTELCRAAGVQRSTFYAHYSDTAELLQEMTERLLNDFAAYWKAHASQPLAPGINRENLAIFFSCVRENQDKAGVLLQTNAPLFWSAITNWITPRIQPISADPAQRQYLAAFYLSGVNNVARIWLKNGCKESVDTLCDIIFSHFDYT